MKVFKLRCDRCSAETEMKDAGSWYEIERYNAREWELAGDSEVFHFCSLPCITAWASSRELVRNAS